MAISTVGLSLLTTLAIDFGIQAVFYVPAAIYKTEKFYDFSGALTFFTCTLVGLLYRPAIGDSVNLLHPRQIVSSCMVLVWCARLGFVLFRRVLRIGHDSRFDELKKDPITFLTPWFFQAVWVFLTAFPVYIIIGIPGNSPSHYGFKPTDVIGPFIWVFGFVVEIVADKQKNDFKNKNPNDFVNVGIWKWSRFANYFGEITLWVGQYIFCAGAFDENWQFASIVSPIFIFVLIYFVSGVRLLERSNEQKYGSRDDYKEYKKITSKFILWPQSNSRTESSSQLVSN